MGIKAALVLLAMLLGGPLLVVLMCSAHGLDLVALHGQCNQMQTPLVCVGCQQVWVVAANVDGPCVWCEKWQ